MSAGMEWWIPRLTRAEVDAGHWALWEDVEGVNGVLKAWLVREVEGVGEGEAGARL